MRPCRPAWGALKRTLAALACGAAVLAACSQDAQVVALRDAPGDPRQGQRSIQAYGCGLCHVIPGVRGADGVVGPPLTEFARRKYIAGSLPNNPKNLVRWIQNPQAIEPGTVMPNMGVTETDARNIAAYLATLK